MTSADTRTHEPSGRWCVCGSPPEEHTPRCTVSHCSCLGYREARSSKLHHAGRTN